MVVLVSSCMLASDMAVYAGTVRIIMHAQRQCIARLDVYGAYDHAATIPVPIEAELLLGLGKPLIHCNISGMCGEYLV